MKDEIFLSPMCLMLRGEKRTSTKNSPFLKWHVFQVIKQKKHFSKGKHSQMRGKKVTFLFFIWLSCLDIHKEGFIVQKEKENLNRKILSFTFNSYLKQTTV